MNYSLIGKDRFLFQKLGIFAMAYIQTHHVVSWYKIKILCRNILGYVGSHHKIMLQVLLKFEDTVTYIEY